MSNQIIKLNPERKIDGAPSVNARDLHAALGVEKMFAHWIKAQIRRAMLDEGSDYILLTQEGKSSALDLPKRANQVAASHGGDRRSIDYFLSMDAAKHIAMMSGTARGKEIRRYFIDCERVARQAIAGVQRARMTPMDAARLYCNAFAMARNSGMELADAHQVAAQAKYEGSGWWWQHRDAPTELILTSPNLLPGG